MTDSTWGSAALGASVHATVTPRTGIVTEADTDTMRMTILGMGTAVPVAVIDQNAAASLAATLRGLEPRAARRERLLYRQAGVVRRHLAALNDATPARPAGFFEPTTDTQTEQTEIIEAQTAAGPGTAARMARFAQEAPALAETACRRALANAGIRPEQITHLVVVTCTGFGAPGVDVALISRLGLPATVERVLVGFMGCHGAINGLRVADGLIRGRADAYVLVCAVELCSLHFQSCGTTDSAVANALFADGAGALVGCVRPAVPTSFVAETGKRTQAVGVLRGTGSYLMPHSTAAMQWQIGDHGFAMTLGAEVPGIIAAGLPLWLAKWLDAQGESSASIAAWAVHPGGSRVLDAVRDAVGLTESQVADSRAVLAEFGNMSSPTVLFILERLRARAIAGPCVVLAFGPGLVVEAALVDLSP